VPAVRRDARPPPRLAPLHREGGITCRRESGASRRGRVHGGIGYSRQKPFEHVYGRHRRYRTTDGSEEIQMRKVAAFLFGFMGPRRATLAEP